MSDDERIILTKEQAIAMLPDGDMIHTFRSASFTLIGADWDRADLLKVMNKHDVELSGSMASAMNHKMVLHDAHGPLFIETKKENGE